MSSQNHNQQSTSTTVSRNVPTVTGCSKYETTEEELKDLISIASEYKKFSKQDNFFARIQNQWRPNEMRNPHKNLTFRFNQTKLKTGFALSGNNSNHVPIDSIYVEQISVIRQSLKTMQPQISQLLRNYRRGVRMKTERLDYLINYRNELRNKMAKLEAARESANSFFSLYFDPIIGQDANQITTLQKAEAVHVKYILNNLRSFYSKPS